LIAINPLIFFPYRKNLLPYLTGRFIPALPSLII